MEADVRTIPHGLLAPARRDSRSVWSDAVQELRRLNRYRYLGKHLFRTSLRSEHVGTFFGYFWWILDPVLWGATYLLLVAVMFRRGGPNYPVFLFTSVIVWKSFVGSVRGAMGQTVGSHGLMKQVPFPRSIIPLTAVAAETTKFFFGLLVLIAFAAGFGLYPSVALLALPLVVLAQLPFMLGVAFLLSALAVLFRDMDNLSQFVFRAWFFLSPALYALSAVPQGVSRRLYDINPFAILLPAYHSIFVDRAVPNLPALAYVGGVAIATLLAGYIVFVRLERLFAKVR